MGIKSINKFLKKKCPSVFQEVDLSFFSGKKVAIDTSLYLCKFKAMNGKNWLNSFIRMITCLRDNKIDCVFIYDSIEPIPEKENERKERYEKRQRKQEYLSNLRTDLNIFKVNGIITDNLRKYNDKHSYKSPKRLLGNITKPQIDVRMIDFMLDKGEAQLFNVSWEDFDKTRELFSILAIPYINAPLEAETLCADLCKKGLVDAVLSDDTDLLAYGTPQSLSKLNINNNTVTLVTNKDLLENLELTQEELVDFCIMCGTDYNKNIYRVGPDKAYKYIKSWKNIEGIRDNTNLDISGLNHDCGRNIFLRYQPTLEPNLNFDFQFDCCPNQIKLNVFLFENNLN